ncbi:MAG: Yip1 family protein [Chloroflexota bacterium]|jgi:hypothetical protein
MPIDKMIKAAMLDTGVYEEVERDTTGTSQAFLVVLVVSFISALGSAITNISEPGAAIMLLITSLVVAIIGWVIWAFLTYWIGTSFFGGIATPGELLRTLGFAYTPNILGFFSFIPCVGPLITFAGSIWALVAGVVAVRQALDFDTGKAIITVVIGWIAVFIVTVVFSLIAGGLLALAFR